MGFKFAFSVILTRGLGATLYGVYAYANTIITFVVLIARLGGGQSLLKFVPANEETPGRMNYYAGLAYATALVGSTLAGVSLYLLAPTLSAFTLDNPLFTDALRIFAIVLPFNAVLQLTHRIFRALEKLEYQVLIADIVQPLAQILAVVTALTLGYSLIGTVAALAVVFVLVCLFALSVMYDRTTVRPSLLADHDAGDIWEFYTFSIPLSLKDVGYLMYNNADIMMVGYFLVEASVGIYRVSFVLGTVVLLPLSGARQLFPSIASRLYSNDELAELQSVYGTVTRWTVTAAIPPLLVVNLYSREILAIFGPEFPAGTWVLVLLSASQFANCLIGPTSYMLVMTDHQYLVMGNSLVLGVLNVVLNYVCILYFGLIGAAVATASTLVLINATRLVELWYTERMIPYSLAFWKPLTAGTLTGLLMFGVSLITEGYVLIVSGSLTGGVVFLALLYLFGIEDDDREFFDEVRSTVD